jgi:homoserine O-succinyltransferase
MPHSRWNGLVEADLERCGYQLITRTDHAGVDCFIKQDRSLFLFFQGHPEYQPETLLHEYRRDVGRFLRGESPRYPGIPLGYFDEKASRELAKIQRHAAIGQHGETFAQLATLFSATARDDGWHTAGSTIYHNWLEYISSEKRKRVANGRSTGVKTSSDALASAAALQAEIAMSGPVPVVPQG